MEVAPVAHSDRRFAEYILKGIEQGFRIGFDRQRLVSAKENMLSALQHPEVVEEYIAKERAEGHFLGPFPPGTFPEAQVSRFGVIPKGRTPGRWRLITDLSSPAGASVNDGISSQLCSLQYTSVDRVAQAAQTYGKGALLAKVDVKSAYRLVPVHPDDRLLLAVRWKQDLFFDAMLPFGLRSAPKIFTAVADAVEWCVRQRGVRSIDHYLDDFILIGPPESNACSEALSVLEEECAQLGVTLAPEKTEGPTTRIRFLGIDIDTGTGYLYFPEDKLANLRQTLHQWSTRRSCQRRDLESLVGILQHAAKVIRPGRTFMRRMIDLLKGRRSACHFIRLNKEFRADLAWWGTFAATWNGRAFFPPPPTDLIEFFSDASGTWGCGAWGKDMQWWQFQWPDRVEQSITFKELFAVVVAASVWGKRWHGRRVLVHCDNEAAVHMLASRSSRDAQLNHLLRCLFFIEAEFNFALSGTHIAGVDNHLADDLSRDKLSCFLSKLPQAHTLPSPIPKPLTTALLDTHATWTSPSWIQQFINTVSVG